VVFDIQRVGPSTGLPTRTAQGDLLSTAVLSHGDTKQIMLIPASAEECYTMAMDAFDLAERMQMLVFVMSDLDLGMNTWMSPTFPYPDQALDRGKRLTPEILAGLGEWGRYKDVDGDGIPYRSVPGESMPASGHNEKAQYSERPDDYVKNIDRLARKFETARRYVPGPVVQDVEGADVGIIGFGSSHWAIEESRDQLEREFGIRTGYLRLRAYPFTGELAGFLDRYERIYVVEQNRDAQMLTLMRIDITDDHHAKMRSVLHYSGLPMDARSVTDDILQQEGLKPSSSPHHEPLAAGVAGRGE
jgi:2-oxoglutarate ferredoxin oxidoreductase subunit alpha